MKLLLDECVTHSLRRDLSGHEVHTVEGAGLKGLENGELLKAAAGAYEVLVTVDQNIPYQPLSLERVHHHFAPSALRSLKWFHLGRWPRLLHFAPLALGSRVFTHLLQRGGTDLMGPRISDCE